MDAHAIRKVFLDVKRRVQGIRDILLVTSDGFPIVSTLETGEAEARSTAVGAIICDAGRRGVEELHLGEIDFSVTFGTQGWFRMRRLREGHILLAVAEGEDAAPLGLILLRLKRAVPAIEEAIDAD